MEATKLLSGSTVHARLRRCLHASEFTASGLRGVAMGVIIASHMGDVVLHQQLQQSTRSGQLPWFTTDILIVLLGVLEALVTLVSVSIRQWRLRSMILASLAHASAAFLMFFTPAAAAANGSELCVSSVARDASFVRMTSAASFRLAIIVIVAVVSSINKGITWSNAVTMMDQADPKNIYLNYGILVAARMLSPLLFVRVLSEQMASWAQALSVIGPLLLHAFQYYRLPEIFGENESRCLSSLRHILSSGVFMGLSLAMALIVAPYWGYMYHELDIIKLLFHIVPPKDDFVASQSELLYFHVAIVLVVTYGMYYTRSVIFDRVSAMKLVLVSCLLLAPLYLVQTVLLTCNHGLVAGLHGNYSQPACSTSCGCAAPASSFAPVCVADSMTTYMSPCHAGCAGADLVDGLTAYRNCSCAPAVGMRRAVEGACSVVECRSPYILHRVLSSCIVIFTVLVLQGAMVVLLRSVSAPHRPLAVSLSVSFILLVTFVGGHLGYLGVRVWTCAWSQGGTCILHTPTFALAIGVTSTTLAATSAIISLIIFLVIRRHKEKDNTELEGDGIEVNAYPQS